jgi:uncharacterized lipoprotein YbaY
MTDDELKAIRERYEAEAAIWGDDRIVFFHTTRRSLDDRLALLAEVERLRALLEAARD